jgi:hypothetical protein
VRGAHQTASHRAASMEGNHSMWESNHLMWESNHLMRERPEHRISKNALTPMVTPRLQHERVSVSTRTNVYAPHHLLTRTCAPTEARSPLATRSRHEIKAQRGEAHQTASNRVAPMDRAHSMWELSEHRISRNTLTPMVTPLSALPSSMPRRGIAYCGSYHRVGCTTTISRYMTVTIAGTSRPTAMSRNIPCTLRCTLEKM